MSPVHSFSRAATLALLLGSLAVAPAIAAPFNNDAPNGAPNSSVSFDANGNVISRMPDTNEVGATAYQPAPQQGRMQQHHEWASNPNNGGTHQAAIQHFSPGDMKAHVESRIKTLHAKLMITSDQEGQWQDVANAMRESEANVSTLIQQRHENGTNVTAVDDLDSYQKIAQAHADGLKKVNAAFSTLYNDMSPSQKKNADRVFGTYEGHGGPEGHPHKAAAKVSK